MDANSTLKGVLARVAAEGKAMAKKHCEELKTTLVCANCSVSAQELKDMSSETMKTCGNCRKIHYCSKECQIEHFRLHKKECKIMRNPSKLLKALGLAILLNLLSPFDVISLSQASKSFHAAFAHLLANLPGWNALVEYLCDINTVNRCQGCATREVWSKFCPANFVRASDDKIAKTITWEDDVRDQQWFVDASPMRQFQSLYTQTCWFVDNIEEKYNFEELGNFAALPDFIDQKVVKIGFENMISDSFVKEKPKRVWFLAMQTCLLCAGFDFAGGRGGLGNYQFDLFGLKNDEKDVEADTDKNDFFLTFLEQGLEQGVCESNAQILGWMDYFFEEQADKSKQMPLHMIKKLTMLDQCYKQFVGKIQYELE